MTDEENLGPVLQQDDKTRSVVSFFKNKLTHEDPKVVRFFDRKEYYTVLGDNALFVAREFYKTSTVIKELGGDGGTKMPGVAVSRKLFNSILKELLVDGTEHTVEVYEDSGGWKRTAAASPGRLGPFQDLLEASDELAMAPVVMAAQVVLRDNACYVSLAYVNSDTRRLMACEFVDDDQLNQLETVLVQIGARECCVAKEASKTGATRNLIDVLQRTGALATERRAAEFSAKHLEQDLGRLLKGSVEHYRTVLDRQGAAGCLAALLSFTELLADRSNHGKFTLHLHDTGAYMRMDATCVRALNVLRQKSDPNSSFSLYGLLNKARTPMGKRLLLTWLKQPLLDVVQIRRRHDVVEALAGDAALREALRGPFLRHMPDLDRLARKLERKRTSLQDLCRLYQASAQLPHIVDALERHDSEHASLLKELFAEALAEAHDGEHLGKFEALLENAVDLNRIPDEYTICANYDKGLGVLKAEKDAADAAINEAHAEAASSLGLPQDKVLKLERSHLGYFFRLSKKEEASVRKKLGRFTVMEARKDGTKFTNPQLKKAGDRRIALDAQYESQQRALVERVVEVASSFTEIFLQVASTLAQLDVLTGFAELSCCAPTPFVRPTMTPVGEGDIALTACRHPSVEVQDNVNFIPNDCMLEQGKSWFQIITGPNMGGKSTFIRQVGVCVLMAQIGCFVPCDAATISVRDAIFARVGAGDCQMRGVSTFMAEMLETASILKGATAASLVIIDELGRGTSTYDGFGLAWAISEHILNHLRCPTLFATHFHELTALKGQMGVANRHVTANIDAESRKLTMLYQVAEGACDQSFGIHCAEFAGFPPEVLELARQKALELEDFTPPEEEQQGGGAKRAAGGTAEDDAQAAAKRVRKFLTDFADMPLPQLTPQQVVMGVRDLREQLEQEAQRNQALQKLLTAQ